MFRIKQSYVSFNDNFLKALYIIIILFYTQIEFYGERAFNMHRLLNYIEQYKL